MSNIIDIHKLFFDRENRELLNISQTLDDIVFEADGQVPFKDLTLVFADRLAEMMKVLPEEEFDKINHLLHGMIQNKRDSTYKD